MKNKELEPSVHQRIMKICEIGDRYVEEGDLSEAIARYREAWSLIPEDWTEWEASTWILSSVGEVYFRKREFDEALDRYSRATLCPNGLGNPYIHLRLGQLHLELGQLKQAGDELTRAYMGAGEEIFQDEDPKFLAFLRNIIRVTVQ